MEKQKPMHSVKMYWHKVLSIVLLAELFFSFLFVYALLNF